MKKFFSILVAFVMMITLANAQTVESSRLFENTYVTLSGGTITTAHTGGQPFFWDGAGNIVRGFRPYAGLEVGKYVTPVVGFSVEGLALFNTLGTSTFVDQSNVVGNVKFNLSNWFGGYPGQPRRVEVVLVPGLGWGHDYGLGTGLHEIRPADPELGTDAVYDRNYFTYNVGVELNVNLGKARAWQINVKPAATWNNYESVNVPRRENLQGRLQVGITYKFGSRKKNSHNFVVCPYVVTAQEYDDLLQKYDNLALQKAKVDTVVVEKEVVKEVVVERQVVKEPALATVLTFPIGSTKLSKVEHAKLGVFARVVAENEVVNIVGSADSATGSDALNRKLAEGRAQVVRDLLVNEFGLAPERVRVSTQFDTNDVAEASRAAVITLVGE